MGGNIFTREIICSLFLYLIIYLTGLEMNCMCAYWWMWPRKKHSNSSFSCFSFFSFSLSLLIFLHHLFVVVRAASGPSAGTDWQLYGMKGLLLLQKDIIGGKVGHGAGELERELETSRRQKSWSQRLGFQKQSGGVFSLLSSFFSVCSFTLCCFNSLF